MGNIINRFFWNKSEGERTRSRFNTRRRHPEPNGPNIRKDPKKGNEIPNAAAKTNKGCVTQWPVHKKGELIHLNIRGAMTPLGLHVPGHVKWFEKSTNPTNHPKVLQATERSEQQNTPARPTLRRSTRIWLNNALPESADKNPRLQVALKSKESCHDKKRG